MCYKYVTVIKEVYMSTNEELSAEIASLKLEMLGQMEELKSIIRFAMGSATAVTPSQQIAALTDGSVLRIMTSKQHAAMQMWLFSGMKMADMARRMNCSRNTARLHLKALWTKMGTEDREVVSSRLLPILDAASDAEYEEWSGGLPKNWAATYDVGRIDPYLNLYVKSKEDTYGKRKT
tara:strand:+ start:2416 stop:2949 length:534 start_codon:yes stop_codon:yes gene_type:complete